MRKVLGLVAAVMAVFALQLAAFDNSADARRYRTRTIVGVGAAALVAGAIIANSSRASARPVYSCESLDRRCYNGSDWACRKYDRHC